MCCGLSELEQIYRDCQIRTNFEHFFANWSFLGNRIREYIIKHVCQIRSHLEEKKYRNIRLAPFYDLISTRVYPEISKKLAMKIGEKTIQKICGIINTHIKHVRSYI